MAHNATIKVSLDEREFEALAKLSENELRPIQDQARLLIRSALRQACVLDADRTNEKVAAGGGNESA